MRCYYTVLSVVRPVRNKASVHITNVKPYLHVSRQVRNKVSAHITNVNPGEEERLYFRPSKIINK